MNAHDASHARLVAGIMSGTSLDGVDVALVRLAGNGRGARCTLVGRTSVPFPEALRAVLLALAENELVPMDDVARSHVRLAQVYADAVRTALAEAGLDTGALDLVGCHGQTVRHLPDVEPFAGADVAATLQLGSGPTLATLLGVAVVSDFRAADMAAGGQGAPLVPYADWVLLGDADESRAALNIGGIANVTVLEAGTTPDRVTAFDTGPGNMVIDALCVRHLGVPFDRDGLTAAQGRVDDDLLAALLDDPWFRRPPPKTTGREAFGRAYVDAFEERAGGLPVPDRIATATALTATSVADAMRRYVPTPVGRLFVSGGGVHNRTLLDGLRAGLPGTAVESTAAVGLDPDAKEAVAFAVLAHEALDRVPTGMPAATGARHTVIQGSLSHPH